MNRLERSGLHFAVATCLASAACLTRPLVSTPPTTKSTFIEEKRSRAIDKIDLLLAIDNSASMKDKQEFLANAVPRLVDRLVTPNCVTKAEDGKTTPTGERAQLDAAGEGLCATGKPEFKPITDIHVGVVSSSLGNFGNADGNALCDQRNADDHAQLLARGAAEFGNKLEGGNFLAWFPDVESNRDPGHVPPQAPYADRTNPGELSDAFAKLVRGTSDEGCGLEAQLESMYQFLIAPQPWQSIVVEGNQAKFDGINATVLAQRSDFLRPDSLVAVIMLTDEDDSSVDPLSVNGQGFLYMSNNFPQDSTVGTPTVRTLDKSMPAARGTAACATDPASPDCTSCAFGGCPPDQTYYEDDDDMNVRFHDMKRRFGVDPQYPVARYVRGLSAPAVPSRDAEHRGGSYDLSAADCTNPLFAGVKLPASADEELCKLGGGSTPRDPSLVFFALVGGVPNDLIAGEARDDGGQLTEAAWTRILGSDPAHFKDTHEDGKDWRMVQSTAPRGDRPTAPPDDTDDDPLNQHFRDWDTRGRDLQYACTFPVPTPTPAADTLDCDKGSDAPLCAAGDKDTKRDQIRAKAYPTIREAWVARDLKTQGILASLCPQNPTDESRADYGYAPAVNDIVDRLRDSLTSSCLPRQLVRDGQGNAPCLMLELMPDGLDCTSDGRDRGRTEADKDIARQLKEQEGLPNEAVVCQLLENPTAADADACQSGDGGWCYLEDQGRCQQQIVFNDAVLARAKGSRLYLQCITQVSDDEP